MTAGPANSPSGAVFGVVNDISVLFVDDEPSLREVVGDYLAQRGFEVAVEASGEMALVALSRRAFDLVITDLRMPGISGHDVVRSTKETQPGAEVIVVTGYATISDGVEAMRAGAFDFILKPLKLEVLDAVLGRCVEWIRHKRSRAELEEVNRRLLEVSQIKGRFLSVTDHELRTPVAVIDGMLQFLLQKEGRLPEDLRLRLQELGKVSSRLVELVQGIHELAHCRTQGFPVYPQWMNASELLEGISVDFSIARFSRDLRMTAACEGAEDIRFRGDRRRVRQVISELIQNAVKATEDGGAITVRLKTRQVEGGERFCVEVADTGIGIAPEERERIFEAFYEAGDERHHHSSKYAFKGAGLGIGLSIALEIARAHGGGIDVASESGQGTCFSFWLPLGEQG